MSGKINIYSIEKPCVLKLLGEDFSVVGGAEFEHNGFFWKEYHLKNPSDVSHWLSVEKDSSDVLSRYTLSEKLDAFFPIDEELKYKDQMYHKFDSGTATVVSFWGDADVDYGEQVFFYEYICSDNQTLTLSCEKWGEETEFSSGRYLLASDISGENIDLSPLSPKKEVAEFIVGFGKVKVGTYLYINGDEYWVKSIIKNSQNSFKWTEFEVVDKLNKAYWLSFEISADQPLLELHKTINFRDVSFDGDKAVYQSKTFSLVEKGEARVTSFTSGDYDLNERFTFSDYVCAETNEILATEKWVDEEEASVGNAILWYKIRVLKKKKLVTKSGLEKFLTLLFVLFFIGIIVYVFFGSQISYLFQPKISTQLERSDQYVFVTDITVNDRNKLRGKTYEKVDSFGTATTDNVAKEMISMDAERIVSVQKVEGAEDPEILVVTKREQVLVYQSEDGTIYVQVSKNDHNPDTSTAPYRSRYQHRARWFYRGSILNEGSFSFDADTGGLSVFNIDTGSYDSYTSSARQSSINARNYSGGGTGFGK